MGFLNRLRNVFRPSSPPKGEGQTNGTGIMYKPITVPELMSETEDVEWLIEGVLPECGILLLTGDAGVGKTWLMMEMALALDVGRDWLGQFKTNRARVLVLDQENGRNILKNRLNQMLGVRVLESGVLFLPDDGILLDDQAQYRALDDMMTREGPQVVILDSLVRFHSGNENDSGDMSAINRLLKALVRKHKCALIICHHNRKPGTGTSDSGNFRGSSEIKAFADNYLDVVKVNKTVKRISNPKCRHRKELDPFLVEIVDVGESQVAVQYLGVASESSTAKTQECIAWVRSFYSDDQEHSRQDTVDAANQHGYSEGRVDAALKALHPSELSQRMVGNSHYYKAVEPGTEDAVSNDEPNE